MIRRVTQHAAVDVDGRPGDECRVVGGEECDRGRDVFRLAEPWNQGVALHDRKHCIGNVSLVALGPDEAGIDCIAANSLRPVDRCDVSVQAEDPGLGGSIGDVGEITEHRGSRCGQDDRTAAELIMCGSRTCIRRGSRAGSPPSSCPRPRSRCRPDRVIADHFRRHDRGVVVQDIQPPELSHGAFDRWFDRCDVAGVELDAYSPASLISAAANSARAAVEVTDHHAAHLLPRGAGRSAAPIPDAPPVTMATFPSSLEWMSWCLLAPNPYTTSDISRMSADLDFAPVMRLTNGTIGDQHTWRVSTARNRRSTSVGVLVDVHLDDGEPALKARTRFRRGSDPSSGTGRTTAPRSRQVQVHRWLLSAS